MIPIWCRESKLCLVLSVLWEEILQVIPLIDICTPHMLDLARAKDCLSRLMATLGESCDIRNVHSENVYVEIGYFFKSVETWEESSPIELISMRLAGVKGRNVPEHMPAIFPIRDSMISEINLLLHDLVDRAILDRRELILISFFLVQSMTFCQQFLGPK